MAGNQIFKTILFPTDFSATSLKALNYVVELAVTCKAELIILHTFRLLNNEEGAGDAVASKKRLEDNARENFKSIEDHFLKNSGLRYSYLSEVGFMADRIISNSKACGADLVVLCDNVQNQVKERAEGGYKGLLNKIHCPVMLVPLSVTDHNHHIH